MKFFFALLLVLIIFIFPQSIGAQNLDKLQIFYYEIGVDGEETLNYHHITIPAWLSVEHRALIIFTEIFDNADPDKMVFVPLNVRVLDAFFFEDTAHLILNVSAEILNYGGTYFEYMMINKLLANAGGIPEVGYFSIWINGQRQYLPEGIEVQELNLLQ